MTTKSQLSGADSKVHEEGICLFENAVFIMLDSKRDDR